MSCFLRIDSLKTYSIIFLQYHQFYEIECYVISYILKNKIQKKKEKTKTWFPQKLKESCFVF